MSAARSYLPPMPMYEEEVWDSKPYVSKSVVVPSSHVAASPQAGNITVQHSSFNNHCVPVSSVCGQSTMLGVSLSDYKNNSDLYLPPEPIASGSMPVPSTPKFVANSHESGALYRENGQFAAPTMRSYDNFGPAPFHSQLFPYNPSSTGNVDIYLPPPIPPNSDDVPHSPGTHEIPFITPVSQHVVPLTPVLSSSRYQPLYMDDGSLNMPTVSTSMYLPPEPVANKISGCQHVQHMNARQYIVPEPVSDACSQVGRNLICSQIPVTGATLPSSTYLPPEPFDDGISEPVISEFANENVSHSRGLQENAATNVQYIAPLPPMGVSQNVGWYKQQQDQLSSLDILGRKSCGQISAAVDLRASLENCSPACNGRRGSGSGTHQELPRQPRNSFAIKESQSADTPDNDVKRPEEIPAPTSAMETGQCKMLGGGPPSDICHRSIHDSNNNTLGAAGPSIKDPSQLAGGDRISSVMLHQVNSPALSLVTGNAGESVVPAKAPSLAASNVSVNSKTTSACAGSVSGSALPPRTNLTLPDVEATIINMTRLIIKQRAQLMTIINPMLTTNPDNLVLMAMNEHYVSLEQEMNRLAQVITLASHLRSSGMCEGLLRQPLLGPISLISETVATTTDGGSVISEQAVVSNIPSHIAVVEGADPGINREAQMECGVTRDVRSHGDMSSNIDAHSATAAAMAVSNSPTMLVDPQRIMHSHQPINIRTD